MNIKQELINLVNSPFYGESEYVSALIGIVYRKHQGDTLKLFLKIQEMDRLRIAEENQLLYRGLEDGMHMFSQIAQALEENRDSRKAKNYLTMVLSGNPSPYALINICKAYFKTGNAEGASDAGRWFFNEFKKIIEETKEKYQEGGSNYDWAKRCDHLDYINLVLDNNPK